ncbi:MAG TPA: hypothetical protein VN603_11740, partial [Candidatus Acidoferrales bacterium]|nr:hypothetical protein [Candidatus Acidoferrales bacterium]
RTSANAICAIVTGRGSTQLDGLTLDWESRDVFSLPHDMTIRHHAEEPSRMFVTTDREVYRRLGLLTEIFGAS